MPLPQLVTSGIELALNKVLLLDPDSQGRLRKLSGRSLQVKVNELPWPLMFSFSSQIDVRIASQDPQDTIADCLIELNLETLPKLKDSSQLTQLIQQKKLNLIGDIYVAQTFSSLMKDLDIDWEEQLAKYTGDVVAHQTFSSTKTLFKKAKFNLEQTAEKLAENLRQPNSVSITQNEMILFSEDVNDLRSHTERLAARIARLEQTAQIKAEQNQTKGSAK
ncbi:SCP2 sterol-binding domain-containing protein [Paraglaciecola aquimarina]|uniref:Ubiquinone biosynthesis accessory factor UbiJ n=1 Tax=Paraglaciecola algarum TaxID=3050085 RepID=A0ABS9D8G6_9ALTE|nr:SCP2 sterol-binding domain-containing protein [Paraglaciecola sp. G1-23]MCF2949214.1 SCP2 sterol-binding domain-containing protein [Paraglaciecola sp. G1-23]